MVSAGTYHTVLLRSDGTVVACGCNGNQQCDIPPLEDGVSYTQAAAGWNHTVLLRSDGRAVACGEKKPGHCNIPPLDDGLSYTQVSAGFLHTVLLRSDGSAVACGSNDSQQCSILPLDEGMMYTQVSAGKFHTVLLRSDGCALANGKNMHGQCDIPQLNEGMFYTQIAAGGLHTVLIQSDGCAVAFGMNTHGQCNIPLLDMGVSYTQVSAGWFHTVLLRSDGTVVTCGMNDDGQCNIPPLDVGVAYIQVSADCHHTVLLRSDGIAVACGCNSHDKCNLPDLEPGVCYTSNQISHSGDLLLEVDFVCQNHAVEMIFCGLTGQEVLRFNVCGSDLAWATHKLVARELKLRLQNLQVILPDGQLLASVCRANPGISIAEVSASKESSLQEREMFQTEERDDSACSLAENDAFLATLIATAVFASLLLILLYCHGCSRLYLSVVRQASSTADITEEFPKPGKDAVEQSPASAESTEASEDGGDMDALHGMSLDPMSQEHPSGTLSLVHPMLGIDYGQLDLYSELIIVVDGTLVAKIQVVEVLMLEDARPGLDIRWYFLRHELFSDRTQDGCMKPEIYHCLDCHQALAPLYTESTIPLVLLLRNPSATGCVEHDIGDRFWKTVSQMRRMSLVFNLKIPTIRKYCLFEGRAQGGRGLCVLSSATATQLRREHRLLQSRHLNALGHPSRLKAAWPRLLWWPGSAHTVLLRSDGCAVACGLNNDGQCSLPALPEKVVYNQISAGDNYTVLLQNDGTAVAFGLNDKGQCDIPPLEAARPYTQVSAGYVHTVLLRSDGSAVACGQNDQGQCNIPPCDPEISYIQVSAGGFHTVLLKSDGTALACGDNDEGQCNIPPLEEGVSYTQVSAGYVHTVLLRSDGRAVACGLKKTGRCNTGALPAGISYTQISAGKEHTVFLRSDGSAMACGGDLHGQCHIPPLRKRMAYTQVSAGGNHTVLLQSDGTAVAVGMNSDGQCTIPSLTSKLEGFSPSSMRYIPDRAAPVRIDRILQLDFQCDNDVVTLMFCTLAGQEVLRLKASGTDLAFDLYKRISRELGVSLGNLRVVLPDRQLLSMVCSENPTATLADVMEACEVYSKPLAIVSL
eukprot:s915_g15.t1